jgi:polysaccharide export outer membrane protein
MGTMHTRGWTLAAALAAGLALATTGCAKKTAAPEPLIEYALETPETTPDYIVEQPDSILIEVNVADKPQFSRSATLRPDGRITMPLLGDVSVTGKSSLEITEQLTKLYTRYLQQVQVTVTVTSYASKSVYIVRDQGSASALPYTGRQDFLKTVARAGGVGGEAAASRILLLCSRTEKPEIRKINWYDIVKRKMWDEAHNPTIHDGDVIFIPMDIPSRIGWEVDKLMRPFYALFQPVRAASQWQGAFGPQGLIPLT